MDKEREKREKEIKEKKETIDKEKKKKIDKKILKNGIDKENKK